MGSWQPLRPDDPDECGGFILTNLLGQGGFGTVFLGFRPDISVPAAVKIFKPGPAANELWRRRFHREIEAIEKMAGVHTAALLDSGGNDDPPWLAMRYIHAPPLDKLIRNYGPFDHLGACWLATGLAEALAEIHAKGILHRDLKPQNILVDRGGLKIIDFGISRFTDGIGVTIDPTFFGTYDFAPNEQLLDPRQVSEKSDVFALGAVLAFVTTGHPPFHGKTPNDRLSGVPPDLDGVPDSLYELVESCLAMHPDHRPTALGVFRTALDQLADFAMPLASDSGPPLPPEIRDFLDVWASEPVPVLNLATSGTGTSSSRSKGSSGMGGASHPGPASAPSPDRRPKAAFNSTWLARWHDAAKRRRGTYGA